jgi:prepilin-type N-terminal cleavage/methylation domain-containing protein
MGNGQEGMALVAMMGWEIRRAQSVKNKNDCPGARGFTLLEILVALVIGTLVVGGVMGVLSGSLQLKARVERKSEVWPVLDGAMQLVLADPALVRDGTLRMAMLPGEPEVIVEAEPRVDDRGEEIASPAGVLHRVSLRLGNEVLETSLIVPLPGDGQ